jgi:hypothetical protein
VHRREIWAAINQNHGSTVSLALSEPEDADKEPDAQE